MSNSISRHLPGNIPDGVIRSQNLDLSRLPQRIVANELYDCSLTGEASELYGELGPNLISCKLDGVIFPSGVSHFDAKDTIFLHSQVRLAFDRIMATQCAFRDVSFSHSTFHDTVFVESLFEEVTFLDCDFAVTTFKSNIFRNCSFVRCATTNKLFEHCLFYHCQFSGIALQEGSILQNYGIQLADTVDLSLYRAETGESLNIEELTPRNRLERISAEFFRGFNLNESQSLLEVVQLNLADATRANILHIVTGIRHLTSFLLFLYAEGKIVLFFPLQLFWSIDQLLGSYGRDDLPLNVLESLEISSARLRRIYEETCLSIPPSDTYNLLINEIYAKDDLEGLIKELGLDVHVRSFQPFNSPSLAEIASPEGIDLLLFVAIVLSTRFRAEIDHYQAERKLLDIGARLIADGNHNPAAAYQALVVLNVPKFLYIRLSARINLSLLGRIRQMVLNVMESTIGSSSSTMAPEGIVPPVITILFLGSNPMETPRLRLDQEIKEIDQALRASGIRQRFRLEQAWAVGDRELQDSLLRYEPDVVHLSAHGTESGRPIFDTMENEAGGKSLKNSENADLEIIRGLTQVFAIAGRQVRCVVLNTCHSVSAAESIAKYVDCVVGMSSSVSDDAAIRFSWSFYNALAYGRSVKDSFDLALAQLALAGYGESDIPKIFPGRSNPSEVVLVRPGG